MTTTRDILIVGGGTAGWLTAAYLARTLGTAAGGVRITLVESSDIGIIGVGEGTFPSIRGTLAAIGLDEARFIRECDATFKQGVKFVDWLHPRDAVPPHGADHYFHPFNPPSQRAGRPSCCRTGCWAARATARSRTRSLCSSAWPTPHARPSARRTPTSSAR